MQLLVPPIHVALHNHDYVANNEDAVNLTQNNFNASSSLDYCISSYLQELSSKSRVEEEKLKLNVIVLQRERE